MLNDNWTRLLYAILYSYNLQPDAEQLLMIF